VRAAARYLPYLLATLGVAEAAFVGRHAGASDQTTTLLLTVLCTLPTALYDRFPAVVTTVVPVSFVVLLSTGVRPAAATIAALVWVYYQTAVRYRIWVSLLLALPFVLHMLAPFDGTAPASIGSLALLALTASTLAIGEAQGKRQRATAERDETLRLNQAMTERTRIARELHDIVAHHVSMIAVQAETARLTTPDLPDLGKQRFGEIGVLARDALAQMRGLLRVLRDDPAPPQPPSPVRVPQPSLEQLPELIAAARSAGDPVVLTIIGPPRPLPPWVELAAYRIVQEALTNVRRHAAGARAEVTLKYDDEEVVARVRDHGPGGEPVDGLGLLGMRERATLAGGTLDVGEAPGGGFLVEARLPSHRSSAGRPHADGRETQ
jgi:signal transduction histidine kinase